MPDSPVEKQGPPAYPHEMETRVAILEHLVGETKEDIRELKGIVRDLATEMRDGFRTMSGKFETTDKSIADLRVEMQSVRTDLQAGLRGNIVWTVSVVILLALPVLGLLGKIAHLY